jgi:hypothetical protein
MEAGYGKGIWILGYVFTLGYGRGICNLGYAT